MNQTVIKLIHILLFRVFANHFLIIFFLLKLYFIEHVGYLLIVVKNNWPDLLLNCKARSKANKKIILLNKF